LLMALPADLPLGVVKSQKYRFYVSK